MTRPLLLAAALLALLAGCSNDPTRAQGARAALGLVTALGGGGGGAEAAAQPDAGRLAVAARQSFAGPIVMVQIESRNATAILGEYGSNGAHRTYATAERQAVTLDRGVLVSTRGLGADLMSSGAAATGALIRARQDGTARRVWRYLDGSGREVSLPMTCRIARGAPHAYDFAGERFSTLRMSETCASESGRQVSNDYWVTQAGLIALSRQWIGPGVGHATIQVVRP